MSLDPQPTATAGSAEERAAVVPRVAYFLSSILHPAVALLVAAALLSAGERRSLGLTVLDLGILAAGILPGLAYIFVRTRRGAFSNYHLLLKEERYTVFPILLLGLAGTYVIYHLLDAPSGLVRATLLGLLGGLGASVINRFWKISIHAAVPMGCSALFLPEDPSLALGLAAMALIAGLARLPIKHHSVAQVAGGWLYGFGVTYLLARMLGGYNQLGGG